MPLVISRVNDSIDKNNLITKLTNGKLYDLMKGKENSLYKTWCKFKMNLINTPEVSKDFVLGSMQNNKVINKL